MRFYDAIKHIKDRVSLVDVVKRYVNLKQNGNRFIGPCPFHQETKPSFSVNEEKGFFHCFGCQASGDIFEFYGKINGLDFKECVHQLAQENGISIEQDWSGNHQSGAAARAEKKKEISRRQIILGMYELAARHFVSCLKNDPESMDYAKKRGLSPLIMEQFGLGWAKRDWQSLTQKLINGGYNLDLACEAGLVGKGESGKYYDRFRGRLIFPIKNLSNQIIAFGGRIIADEDEAKYINSPDTPVYKKKEHLYGLAQARKGISTRGHAILTEGYMDVLTLHQFGYDNGVGVLGTALTEEQIKRLSGFTSSIYLLFDGDRAGRKAALRSAEMLLARGLSCKVVLLPEGEDIDSLLRKAGPEEFSNLQDKEGKDGLKFCIDVIKKLSPREAREWSKNFLDQVKIPELVNSYTTALTQGLDLPEEQVRKGLRLPEDCQLAVTDNIRSLYHTRDMQILIFAVRYPERLDDLRGIGADMALSSPAARQFWELLEQWGADEVFYHLNEKQKKFWQKQRGPGSAPLDRCEHELACLKHELASFYSAEQIASLSAALRENTTQGSFEADLEYLRAMQETVEKKK